MRIAIFSDTFYPTVNGVVSSVINFAKGLTQQGHQVLLVVPDHPRFPDDLLIGEGIEIVRLRSVKGGIYPDFRIGLPTWGIYQRVVSFDPEVIHSFTPAVIGLMAIVLGKRLKKPLVYTNGTKIDDEKMLLAIGKLDAPLIRNLHKVTGGVMKRFLELHDVVIISTKDAKKGVEMLKPKVKLRLVKTPVLVDNLITGKKAGKELRKELEIKKAVLFSGRLSGEKKVEVLIRAMSLVMQEFKDLKLVLIGDGPERDRLFTLASELGVVSRIVWLGQKPYEEVVNDGYYYLGDIFVTMSVIETQGLSTVEAMACGLVPVGVRGTATEEVIGKSGIVVEADNSVELAKVLKRLLNNREEMKRKSKLAIQIAATYSVEECCQELVMVYTELVR